MRALARIAAQGRILATGRAIRGGTKVVCFTAVPLDQIGTLRTFRAHPWTLGFRAIRTLHPEVLASAAGNARSGTETRHSGTSWLMPSDLTSNDDGPETAIKSTGLWKANGGMWVMSTWPAYRPTPAGCSSRHSKKHAG